MSTNNIYVAKIGKTVGLHGHLRLIIETDFPEQFKKDEIFILNNNIELKVLEYNSSRQLIKFENYENVDVAKKLTNKELYTTILKTKENCKLKKNEFFWFDLISCEVFENNLKLGTINDLHRYPTNDYLQVITDSELIKKNMPKLFLIPHIFDKFILNIDIENKRVDVINSFDILENS